MSYIANGSGGGGAPSGAAGGDLGSTYPNPTVVSVADVTTGVLAPANGGVALSNSAGLGGQFIALDMGWGAVNSAAGQIVTGANIVDAFQFTQRYTQTFTRMAIRVTTTFGASSHVGIALYDSTGARITNATTGALDGTNTGATQVVTVTAVTINPGIYYIGVSSDGATSGRLYAISLSLSNAAFTQFVNTARGNRIVTGASVSAGGVPPATLGALSSNVSSTAIPLLWIEP